MCLILVAHQVSPQRPLLVLANRDEYYARPTAETAFWPEAAGMLAGRDLVAGGTWLGVRGQRWAAVTNVREGITDAMHQKSRGWLVRDYLLGSDPAEGYLQQVMAEADAFPGFNLLLGDNEELWYGSNRAAKPRKLPPGLYGLSNYLLDTPWPKVTEAKRRLAELLRHEEFAVDDLLALMADRRQAPDAELPETGIPLEWERALSAMFIATEDYGTRSTSLLLRADSDRQELYERRYDGSPERWQQDRFEVAGTKLPGHPQDS